MLTATNTKNGRCEGQGGGARWLCPAPGTRWVLPVGPLEPLRPHTLRSIGTLVFHPGKDTEAQRDSELPAFSPPSGASWKGADFSVASFAFKLWRQAVLSPQPGGES